LVAVENLGLAVFADGLLESLMQKPASIVIDTRCESTRRLNPSTTATR
jgi:hypothetical protein